MEGMENMSNENSGSDDSTNTGATGANDASQNLEVINSKFSKMQEENQRLSQQLTELTTLMQNQMRSQPQVNSSASGDEDLEDLAYKDPKAYARKVSERAEARAARLVEERLTAQQQTNGILSQLGSEYPELNDSNSDLTIKAVDIYKRMSEADRKSPLAYKAAVRDAAAELGLLPKSKRKTTGGEVPNISSDSSSSQNAGQRQPKSKDLDPKTLAFAKLIGLDTSKKEVVERLKSRAQRSKWSKYE